MRSPQIIVAVLDSDTRCCCNRLSELNCSRLTTTTICRTSVKSESDRDVAARPLLQVVVEGLVRTASNWVVLSSTDAEQSCPTDKSGRRRR